MLKILGLNFKRVVQYGKLTIKYSINVNKCYLRAKHYNWHLMQTKQNILLNKNAIYQARIEDILSKYQCIKPHFLYACRIGECFHRISDIVKDKEYFEKDKAYHLFIPDQPIANYSQLELLSNQYEVVSSENIEFWEYVFNNYHQQIDSSDYERYRGRKGVYCLEAYHPMIEFSPKQIVEAENLMQKMGIGKNDEYICIHARDAEYLKTFNEASDKNTSAHAHRDCDIENYFSAAEYAVKKGLRVVRMGQYVEKKVEHTGIIDYANKFSNPLLDLYLQRRCKYFVGSSAGLIVGAAVFATPKIMANIETISLGLGSLPFTKYDRFLPLKYWSEVENRFLTFREMMEHEIRAMNHGNGLYYEKQRLRAVQNTAEEILEVTKELHENLEGTYLYDSEDEVLYRQYQKLVDDFSKRHDTANLLHGGPMPIRIGAQFLKKNKLLLE